MQKRTKRILNIAANSVIGVICVIILLLAVSTINSKDDGYSSLFGYSLFAVKSDSMTGSNKDSFPKGALVVAKVLKDDQKKGLPVGKVITFKAFDAEQGVYYLNTHRIYAVDGDNYITKGDNYNEPDRDEVIYFNVISEYRYHIKGVGAVINFVQSTQGFLIVVVIPSLLIVAYAVYNLLRAYSGYNKAKLAAELEQKLARERAEDQAKHDSNKLAEEEQAAKEAQLRAELEAKIKAEMQAEQAQKEAAAAIAEGPVAKEDAKPAAEPVKKAPVKKPAAEPVKKAPVKKPAAPKPAAKTATAPKTATKKTPAPKAQEKKAD
ncbi:MAG: hypothetical protein ACOYIQ_05800 [Christensenellales bacterium]|jgi:signal peptidase